MNIKFVDIGDSGKSTVKVDAVRIGIRNVLSTKKGELGHDLDFGCQIDDELFELCNEDTALHLKLLIEECLKQETRIQIEKLDVTPIPEQHLFHVYLEYSIPELQVQDSIELQIQR